MVNNYAIIKDNKVINRIVAEEGFITTYCDEIEATYTTDEAAVIGAEYIGGEWVVPDNSPVPSEVTRFQARAALHQSELLTQVQAIMEDPETDPIAVIAWQDAQVFKRNSPTILAIADQMELTGQEIDDLFRLAATLEA